MSPNLRRAFDISLMALAGACLSMLAWAPQDVVLSASCTGAKACFLALPPFDGALQHSALATLTAIGLYAFLVRLPLHYKQLRLKKRFACNCRSFKVTLITLMVSRDTGSTNIVCQASLLDPINFRAYFETELSPGRTRWDAFRSNLDQTAQNSIFSAIKSLHDEITFVLNNITVQSTAPLEFRKRLSVTLIAVETCPRQIEKSRLLGNCLWGIFARRDVALNIQQEDFLEQTLCAIDSACAVPFTQNWWRKREAPAPISAYETLV
jgi:hypothetical protein